MTNRFDKICIGFAQKIPTAFKTTFTPGNAMPDTYLLTKEIIADFVNAALLKLFNQTWQAVKGDTKAFIQIFPELSRLSDTVVATLTNGTLYYNVIAPYMDFNKLIGAVTSDNKFIKIWDETKFTIALSGIYDQYTTTSNKPAIIGLNRALYLFPQNIVAPGFKFQYIALPLDPTTGDDLIQNGSYDSPFTDQWNAQIADMAYDLYLEESQETT